MILTVGAPAAGGACVARAPDGRVVFVRHCLPGETVRVVVTSEGSRFLRADAVEVLSPSEDRVEPPCPYAGPGRCGGCDWQHASAAAQLTIKTGLVREQLRHLAGFDWEGAVEPVEPTLGWRTRVQWAGGVGFHRHRSEDVQPVDRCLIAAPGCDTPPGPLGDVVEVAAADGQQVVTVDGRGSGGLRVSVLGRRFEVAAGGFWQVHVAAASVLAGAVLEALSPQPGESAVDLYAGVGLFAALLGERVGPSGSVLAVEASTRACADAARNTADQPWVRVRTATVEPSVVRRLAGPQGIRGASEGGSAGGGPDLVVLDPPRAGAGQDVTAALAGLRPRALAYVSCDAATLARDLRVLLDAGWSVTSLRAFDLFPQTEHVELLAVLRPPP